MTEIDPSQILLDKDCIYFRGVKYQKVEEPKTFYDNLWELVRKYLDDTVDCDELTDRIMDLIRSNIPEPMENKYHSDVLQGFNTAIKNMQERF